MGNVSVHKTSDGFIVTRGSDTFTVVDSNQNGRIDNADVWNMAGKKPLTQEERWEAMGLSLAKEDMTTEEMSQYQAFLEQREAYAKQKEQQQQQAETQNNKKVSFWDKLSAGIQIALPFMSMTSGFMGILGSFSLNNNSADNAIKWNSIMNTMQMSLSSLAMFGMFNKAQNNSTITNNATNPYGFNFNTGMTNGLNFNMGMSGDYSGIWQNALQMQSTFMSQYAENVAKAQQTTLNTNAKNRIEQLLKYNEEEKITLSDVNKAFLEEMQDEDGEKTYTQDDIAYINQITNTPRIPVQHIDVKKEENETQISKNFASKLEKLLKKYDDATGDLKLDVMKEEEYNTIKEILDQPTLTKEQIEILENLYEEITTREKEEDNDEEE